MENKTITLSESEFFKIVREAISEEIEINPKNIGKFNSTKKRTGKSTEELAHSKNKLTKKRAIFALNMEKANRKRRKR